jgi:hypothetical protein
VRVGGLPYSGLAYFKFAIVNGANTYWSNDGTTSGEPSTAVELPVSHGLFSVLLGDTTLGGGMTQILKASVFEEPDRFLRVWFSTSPGGPFSPLGDDTRIAAVPYALQAELAQEAQKANDANTVDGLHANAFQRHYQNVVIVAKSGGDHTSVQDAIDGITDAAADNPYLVWVAPGVYSETVTMVPHVHLQGAGQRATVISSTASSSAWPFTEATLTLAGETSLRDLTVANTGDGTHNVALFATGGATQTLVSDVTARALAEGAGYAICVDGGGTEVTLQQVTALAESGSTNYGLHNANGAAATVRSGSFTGRGGVVNYGVFNDGSSVLDAEGITALAENGLSENYGLYNDTSAVTVRDCSFTARAGIETWGIYNRADGTILAEGITVVGEDGYDVSCGLYNVDGEVTLRGGSITCRGGENARGIENTGSVTTLEARDLTVLSEDGTNENVGLYNDLGAAAALRAISITVRGGTYAWAILNDGSGTALQAGGVTALAEDASDDNHGLHNDNGAAATLRGGSFTGSGGYYAHGILSTGSGTTLDALGIAALGENSFQDCSGLRNTVGAAAALHGGSFSASGPNCSGHGMYNAGATLEAEKVTALGGDHSSSCGVHNSGGDLVLRGGSFTGGYGLFCDGGSATADSSQFVGTTNALGQLGCTVHLGVCQLDGDHTLTGGSLTCFQVYDGSYTAYDCTP